MKELIFISFLLVVIVAFVVGYLTGKDAVKQKRRRTPHAPAHTKSKTNFMEKVEEFLILWDLRESPEVGVRYVREKMPL